MFDVLECAVEDFLWVVVVAARTGTAINAADSRNARLARDKSIWDTSKKGRSWTLQRILLDVQ